MNSPAQVRAFNLARLRQIALIAMGWTIIVIGVIIMPLPGPFGLPVVILGGLLLLRNSPNARKTLIRWKRSAPARLSFVVTRMERWREKRRMRRRPR